MEKIICYFGLQRKENQLLETFINGNLIFFVFSQRKNADSEIFILSDNSRLKKKQE